MVTRYTKEGWEIITQRAHGIIAAQLAFNWRVKDRPERWVETVLAIAEHDDAENELDGEELLTKSNGPLNYDMKNFDLQHCKNLASLTITKSRYIALLTSMHMEFLYGESKDSSKDAASFLKEQQILRNKWLKELGITRAAADKIYDLVEWCDALSLLICTEILQPLKRTIEISKGPDKRMYYLNQFDDNTLVISPWPFESDSFEINYDYRLLETVEFQSSADLRKQFLNAPVLEKRWTIKTEKLLKNTISKGSKISNKK